MASTASTALRLARRTATLLTRDTPIRSTTKFKPQRRFLASAPEEAFLTAAPENPAASPLPEETASARAALAIESSPASMSSDIPSASLELSELTEVKPPTEFPDPTLPLGESRTPAYGDLAIALLDGEIPPQSTPPPRSRPAVKLDSFSSSDGSATPKAASMVEADPVHDRLPGQKLNIYEMDAQRLASEVQKIEDLEDLVGQVERMPKLLGTDVGPLLMPLSRLTSMDHYGQRGADLTQRLLLTCLSRLPVEVKDRYSSPDLNLPYPPASLYTRAAIAWANLASREGAERAEMVFQLQLQEYLREREYLQSQTQELPVLEMEIRASPPDRRAYKSRIRAWAVSKAPGAAAKAYEILRELEQLSGVPALLQDLEPNAFDGCQRDKLPPLELEIPDIGTYNVVLTAYSKEPVLQHPTALEKCKKIVRRIENIRKLTLNDSYKLDAYTYVSLLKAYERWLFCQQLLDPKYTQEICDIVKQIHEHIQSPEYIAAKAKEDPAVSYKRKMDGNNKQNARDDSSIFFPLSFAWAYGVVVDALVKTQPFPQNILHADEIVIAMTGRLNRVNDGSDQSGPLAMPPQVTGQVWPRDETLMQVVRAWERSGLPDRDKRVERLLYIVVVEQQYSRIFYLHVSMNKWCDSSWKSTPELVEAMLGRSFDNISSERKKPTGQTFAIAMKAWLRSKSDMAPQRVELLLQRMLKLYDDTKDTRYRPEETHLRYLMTCWVNLCADGRKHDGGSGEDMYPAEHCENLVMWMRDKPWASNRNFLSGQVAMAIRAWAQQGIQAGDELKVNPVQRAVKLVNLLGPQKIPSFPCNWVLEACRRKQPSHERKKEAYDTAIAIFGRAQPNARTYVLIVSVLRAQVKALRAEHVKVVEELFTQSCRAGMVSQDMIWHLAELCPADSLQRILGLSSSYAQMIVEVRHGPMGLADYKAKIPASLEVSKMPPEWCGRADTSRKEKTPVGFKKYM